MSIPLIDSIDTALFGITGSYELLAIIILTFFIIAFIITGIPFKYAIMFSAPLVQGFVNMGWLQPIVGTIMWLLVGGWGTYLLISTLSDR